MNLVNKLKALAFGAMFAFGATSASAAVIDFTGSQDGSGDGVMLSCSVQFGFSCSVTTNDDGLGVGWALDSTGSQVDNFGPNESITLSFAQDMVWNNVTFGRWGRFDDAQWAADGASGSFSDNSGVLDLGGYVSSFLTISANNANLFDVDKFTIESIDVAPVPLPAAGFLLLGGIGGLALMRRRQKA